MRRNAQPTAPVFNVQQPQQQPQNFEQDILIKPDREDLLRWQLDTRVDIQDLMHTLRGDEWDEDKMAWVMPEVPRVNALGLKKILSTVASRTSKNPVLNNIDREEIITIMRGFRINLIDVLYKNYKEFEIDKSDLSSILDDVDDFVFVLMTRGREGVTLKHLGERVRTVERMGMDQDQKKDGLLPNIFGKIRGR